MRSGGMKNGRRSEPRKRPREASSPKTANGKRSRGGSESESDDEMPAQELEKTLAAEASTSDVEDSDSEASGSYRRSRGASPTTGPACGIVKRIYVENFMCHEKLTLDPSERITFVTGPNGSGKSAILAALQICLGASARATHRGKRLKELIRVGADRALARVTLRNEGDDAFRPEAFGAEIVIERKLVGGGDSSSSSSSSLKLTSGSQVLTGAAATKELKALLEELKITVENPVCLLDQEASKEFIRGKRDKKYEFFEKATELQETFHKIRLAHRCAERVKKDLERNAKMVESFKRTSEEAEKTVTELEAIKAFDDKIRVFEVVKFLVTKKRAEKARDDAKVKYDDAVAKLQEATRKFDEADKKVASKYDGVVSEVATAEENVKRLREDLTQCLKSTQEANERWRKARRDQQTKAKLTAQRQARVAEIRRERAAIQKSLDKTLKENERKRQEASSSSTGEASSSSESAAQKKNPLEVEATEIKALEDRKKEVAARLRELEKTESTADAEARERKAAVRDAENAANRARAQEAEASSKLSEVNDLRASGDDRVVRAFGEYQVALRNAIRQNRHKFTAVPVGPLGSLVSLRDDASDAKWVRALSTAIPVRTLESWVVENRADRDTLRDLARQIGRGPLGLLPRLGVIQQIPRSRHAVADLTRVSGGRIPRTALSVLRIPDDCVFNALVDHAHVEAIPLYDTREEAERRAIKEVPGGRFEYAVSGAYIQKIHVASGAELGVKKGGLYTRGHGSSSRFGRGGPPGLEASLARAGSSSEDVGAAEDAVKEAADAVREAEAHVTEMRRRLGDLDGELGDVETEAKRARDEQRRLEADLRRRKRRLADLQAELEERERSLVLADTSAFEQDIARCDDELKDSQRELQDAERTAADHERTVVTPLETVKEQHAERNVEVGRDLKEAEAALFAAMDDEKAAKDAKRKLEKEKEAAEHHHQKVAALLESEEDRFKKADDDYDARKRGGGAHDDDASAAEGGPDAAAEGERPSSLAASTLEAEARHFKTEAAVDAKIKTLRDAKQKRLESDDLAETNLDAARASARNAAQALKKKRTECSKIEEEGRQLHDDVLSRFRKLERFRKTISSKTSIKFNEILATKGASGELAFDHRLKTLDVTFQKDNTDQSTQLHNVNSFSGGERSFTTLALLVALGNAVDCPFRVMDEFDVFMDQVARKLAMRRLVDMATMEDQKQFIFITPQDLSSLDPNPIVKIVKLHAPKRGQTTLNFSSSGNNRPPQDQDDQDQDDR